MACTIGAKLLERGAYILFKNKDLHREWFVDDLVVEDEVFGVVGIHLPLGGSGPDLRSGFSLGANAAGICACNSHVRSLEDGANYDLLTEAAVRGTRSVAEACEAAVAGAHGARFNWCNIVIAGPGEMAVVEVADDVAHARGLSRVTRANGHLLPHNGGAPAAPDARAARAEALFEAARGVGDVAAICRSHEGDAEASNICAHGTPPGRTARTVYSYILHARPSGIVLWVRQGRPCEGAYRRIPLRFPLDPRKVRSAYPCQGHEH